MSASSSLLRPSRYIRRGRRPLLFVVSAALLAAGSLFGKAANYNAETEAHSGQAYERRVQDFLTGRGWVLSESADLVSVGSIVALNFQVPGCIGRVRIDLLSPNGEMASLLSQVAGPNARVFYAYRGQISRDLPRFAYFYSKVAGLMAALGVRPQATTSVIAVSQPQGCQLEAAVPWSEL
jgi:hypothetical protein